MGGDSGEGYVPEEGIQRPKPRVIWAVMAVRCPPRFGFADSEGASEGP